MSNLDELGWKDNKDCQGGFYLNSDLAGSRLSATDFLFNAYEFG